MASIARALDKGDYFLSHSIDQNELVARRIHRTACGNRYGSTLIATEAVERLNAMEAPE